MGFDDNQHEGDLHLAIEGLDVVVSETSKILLDGATIDYVEIEPDTFQFIFMNPNDVNYVPPEK
jgi:iron-sulfur cluster assembly protein